MRRLVPLFLVLLFFFSISFASAQTPAGTTGVTSNFKALAPIPGLTGETTSVLSSDSLAEFFNNLYIYAIGMAAAIAVIQIIYAGLEIAFFNKDSVSRLMDSKGRIAQSIYGLILIFSPVVVFSIINPAILNLELNLQPLDIHSSGGTSQGGDSGNIPNVETNYLPDGTSCTKNVECESQFCSPATNTCKQYNLCDPYADPSSSKSCGENRVCVAKTVTDKSLAPMGQRYECIDDPTCKQGVYSLPEEFSEDVTEPCPDDRNTNGPYFRFCPTGVGFQNQCRQTSTVVFCAEYQSNGCVVEKTQRR